jgi:hypothetical protein
MLNGDRKPFDTPYITLTLTFVLALTGVSASAQSQSESNQRANESDHVMVSRSVSKADEDSPHGRKGKKGIAPTAVAKRAEPPIPTQRARATRTSPQPARKMSSRATNSARIESPTASKVESTRGEEPAPPAVFAASDRIEVVEWGSKPSNAGQALPTPTPVKPGVSSRRYDVEMDPGRVQQIQQALISRGFLTGEPTSVYDEATVEAMRQFQVSQKIDATGYPTAHALKRLGL